MNTFRYFCFFFAFAASIAANTADDWRDGVYMKQLVDGKPVSVTQLLRDFGKGQRVPVIINEGVSGDIIRQYSPMKPEDYLTALCSDNNLFWFERNSAIFIYPSDDLDTRVMSLGGVEPSRLVDLMRRFGLYSKGFPPRIEPDLGLMYLTGPTPYLDEVQLIVDGISSASGTAYSGGRPADIAIEVFPLQYAWVDDRTFTLGNREYAVPGMATLLNNVLTGSVAPGGLLGRTSTLLPNNRPGLRGSGLIGPYNQLIASSQQAAIDSQVAAARAEAQLEATSQAQTQLNSAIASIEGNDDAAILSDPSIGFSPVIQADSRLNAIIIKDYRGRMDSYRKLISELDQPVSLVEIKASIIDIDATHGFEFGLPGNVTFNNDGTQRSILANLGTTDITNLAAAGNLTFQLADGAVNQLLVNLKALESDGHARVHAKPSVVTLDNQDAFLEESEEFFVRVAGNDQVDLFNVTVGTKLTITPHIVPALSGRQIRLSVNIEDGSRSATQQVDQIPVVSRNAINTQAVLLEGQSLLIGGLTRERETKNVRAVPVLGRIPKVGVFFRETVTEKARLERLVLLTPTIIEVPNGGQYCNGGSGCPDPTLMEALGEPAPDVEFEPLQQSAPRETPAPPSPSLDNSPESIELPPVEPMSRIDRILGGRAKNPFLTASSSRVVSDPSTTEGRVQNTNPFGNSKPAFDPEDKPGVISTVTHQFGKQFDKARSATKSAFSRLPFRKQK